MTPDSARGVVPLLSACNFVIGMGAFVIVGLIPPVAQDFDITTAQAGYMLTVYALAYAVLSPLLVAGTGSLGRRRVLALGLALFSFGMALSAAAGSVAMPYVARGIAAAGAGIFTPVAATVAAGLSPPDQRGKALAAVFFGLTLAQVLGVPAGSWIALTFGWRIAFWIVLMLGMIGLWLVWSRVPAGLQFQPVNLRDLGRTLGNLRTTFAVLFTTTFLAGIYVPYTFLSPLLQDTQGYGRDGITLALVLFGAGAVIGNLMGGRLSDRLGPVRTLVILCLAQIVLMPVYSALPLPDIAVLALILAWATCGWGFMAPQQVRLLSLAPDQASVVLAMNAAAIYIGAAVGSAIGGQVVEQFGVTGLGAVGGGMALLALGHVLWSHRQATLAQITPSDR